METLTSPPLPKLSQEDSLHTLSMDLVVESLPILPMDLVTEILCRLPVKFLLQFRSVCKLWNSLISDQKFAKKHLHLSPTRSLNSVFYFDSLNKFIFESRPLDSLFSTISMDAVTQFEYSPKGFDGGFNSCYTCYIVGSCNGILCLAHFLPDCFVIVWNPSIRKFIELPPLIGNFGGEWTSGFGYDHVNDNYKVVIVLKYPGPRHCRQISSISKIEVKVYTFGTNLWKNIGEFPFGCVPSGGPGTFVCGAVNWLAFRETHQCLIVSFNLKNESFQEILQPVYGEVDEYSLSLGVLRDCLCMYSDSDVWLMKEYGNKESWIKLLTISYKQDDPSGAYFLANVICMFADDQVLLEYSSNRGKMMTSFDLKTGTYKFINFQNKIVNNPWKWDLEVCSESLILP